MTPEEIAGRLFDLIDAAMKSPATIADMKHEVLRLVAAGGTGRVTLILDVRAARDAELVMFATPSSRSIPRRVHHVVRLDPATEAKPPLTPTAAP